MDDFLSVYGSTRWLDAEQVLLALLIPFLLSSFVASIYRWTFQSVSYSRSFVHTMVLSSMVVSMVIMAVGDSFARGLGILGSLAIVRFRTPVRDPRDMVFLYACMGLGIACGAAAFGVAIVSAFAFSMAAVLLHWVAICIKTSPRGASPLRGAGGICLRRSGKGGPAINVRDLFLDRHSRSGTGRSRGMLLPNQIARSFLPSGHRPEIEQNT